LEREIVLKVISEADRPLKVGEIERITGIDRNKIQKIINQFHIDGVIVLDKCYNKILGIKGEQNG